MALRAGITSRRRSVLPSPRAFSSSSSPFPPPPPPANDPDAAHSPSFSSPPNPGAPRNPASSRFLDIGDRLRSSPTPPSPRGIPTNPPRLNPARGAPTPSPDVEDVRRMLHNFRSTGCAPSSSEPAAEDIRRMLQNFRSTGGAPSTSAPGAAPSPSASAATPSFMDLFWKTGAAQGPNAGQGVPGLDAMPGSLRPPRPQMPFRPPSLSNNSRRELERNPEAVRWGQEEKNSVIALKRNYSYEELGKRLGELRPAGAGKDGKDWFSLKELQGRIAKLVELEKQSAPSFSENQYATSISELRNCFENLQKQEKPAPRVNMQALALQNLGGQLDYMGRPPQEELLEKYFHPDHMSSEEKMKLELQRVRDEFKMSENDCGSARVQIAQLTLKIKHLSAVLHKKDKHSRKGLQEMVQRRKKYLKYLRTTDWDSYCLVLSKLGLRDVPEYKAPDYKSKATTKVKSKKKSKGKGKGKGKKRKMKA